VKSVKDYNRVVGVKSVEGKKGRYILIIHYRHDGRKPDEFYYLTQAQITRHHLKGSEWGDLVFNKAERARYSGQTLQALAEKIMKEKI
jgi:hypothetical protein